jgi:hypothetical protein
MTKEREREKETNDDDNSPCDHASLPGVFPPREPDTEGKEENEKDAEPEVAPSWEEQSEETEDDVDGHGKMSLGAREDSAAKRKGKEGGRDRRLLRDLRP